MNRERTKSQDLTEEQLGACYLLLVIGFAKVVTR
jgi:hypothetical protein